VCLLAFGLNATVFARSLVHCQNADGATRLEWGCDRDVAGHCEQAGDGQSNDPSPVHHDSDVQPCDDDPVTIQPFVVRNGSSHAPVTLLAPLPAHVTMLGCESGQAMETGHAGRFDVAERLPPPSVHVVRAVIFLI